LPFNDLFIDHFGVQGSEQRLIVFRPFVAKWRSFVVKSDPFFTSMLLAPLRDSLQVSFRFLILLYPIEVPFHILFLQHRFSTTQIDRPRLHHFVLFYELEPSFMVFLALDGFQFLFLSYSLDPKIDLFICHVDARFFL
jgi:hypothetical protein